MPVLGLCGGSRIWEEACSTMSFAAVSEIRDSEKTTSYYSIVSEAQTEGEVGHLLVEMLASHRVH